MKILEVNTEKTWRGGERQTLYTLRGFRDAGIEVTLLCRKGFPLHLAALKEGIPVITVEGNISTYFALAKVGSLFDLIHTQTAKTQTAAAFTKWLHRRKVVNTRRVDFVQSGWLTKLKYSLTDHTVCISTPIQKILSDFGVLNTSVIYSMALPKSLDRARAQQLIAEVKQDRKVVLTLAALVQHKDPLTLVRAVAELAKKRKDFVLLHFGNGVLEEEVRKEIASLGVADFYKLMGFVQEAEDLFAIADLFVMSSEEEGLGSVVLDAFQYKVPVVSTDAGGLGEIVVNHGLLSPVHDYKMLANNLGQAFDHPLEMSLLTERAHSYVQEKHSVQYSTTAYQKIFQQLLN